MVHIIHVEKESGLKKDSIYMSYSNYHDIRNLCNCPLIMSAQSFTEASDTVDKF